MTHSRSMTKWCAVALFALVGFAPSARADVMVSFDTPVVTGPTQAPGVWYTDRYAPAGFSSPQVAPDGRPGTLQHSIAGSDFQGAGSFYNTQGRKYDLPAGTISAQIQLYIPSGTTGRYAGFWATAFDGVNPSPSAYPIIEYNNGGFRVWDSGTGWNPNLAGFTGTDQWYTLGFDLVGGDIRYFINGAQVATVSSYGSTSLGNVILQGHNTGTSYDIYWDGFSASANAIPEPTTLALFGLGGLVVVACRRRRTTASA